MGPALGFGWIQWEGRWVVDRGMGKKAVGRVNEGCVGKYLESHLTQ